jgi:hypothetical protein
MIKLEVVQLVEKISISDYDMNFLSYVTLPVDTLGSYDFDRIIFLFLKKIIFRYE